MNFLAHLFLGPHQPEQALGSLLGDFVKGPVPSMRLPEAVREGIWLHRQIDSFTDSHPLVRRSRERVSTLRRRYAGIMVDMFYDHLLARHWQRFSEQSIEHFTTNMYAAILRQEALVPEHAWPVLRHMAEHDWLTRYAQLGHLHRALDNMSRRLRRENPLPGAVFELEAEYAGFEADFLAFMPQAITFASDQAARLATGEVVGVSSLSPRA